MNTPFVSICIPCYKAEKYLEPTLRSIAAQEFKDWEVILTEDGSKDRVEEILTAFKNTVPQPVTYNRHPANRGLPATRNTGIETARGQWVAFLDADDLWKPDHLSKLAAAATRGGDCEMVYAGSVLFDDETGAEMETRAPTSADLADLPVALYSGAFSIMPSSVMIRRTTFDRIGFVSTDFPHVNDTEYWLRVLSKGGQVRYSGANSCLYRKHAGSMSRRAAEILMDSARLCERYSDWAAIPRALRRARPASLYRWAGRTLLADNPTGARDALVRALRLEPLNAKTIGLWSRAVLSQKRQPSKPAPAT